MDNQKPPMKAMLIDVFNDFWSRRNKREKALLAIIASLLSIILLYRLLWAPAANGSARLALVLPAMQSELSQMTQQAQQARELKRTAIGTAPTGEALRNALTASLAARGIDRIQISVQGRTAHIQLKNISFGTWVSWLDEIRKQIKIQVIEAQISSLDQEGQVDLKGSLQIPTFD
jgi:general secretion pathway protein M